MDRFTGVLGILAVLLAAWLGSTDRRHIRWRTVAWGLSLQVIFAFLVLRFDYGQRAMAWAGDVVNNMLASTEAGTKVLFGALGTPNTSLGSIFAFQVLPTIIFISAFFAVLYHIGVMQIIIRGAGVGDAEDDAHLRRGEHECGGVDLHGTDGSAADDSAVSVQGHAQRADDDHDQRHGACVGRHHGHVHCAGH